MFLRRSPLVATCLVVLAAVGCTQSTPPTAPSSSPPALGAGASISGTVSGIGSGAGAAPAALTTGGLTVSIDSTDLLVSVDASGHFEFNNVPTGDVQLRFRGLNVNATALVSSVAPDEQIQIQIDLATSTAIIVDEVRSRPGRPGEASVRIEKSTNGRDADEAPGPDVPVGEPVVWEYVVTNTGNLPLGDIVVEDNPQGRVECPRTALDVGDSMTCRLRDTAQPGPYRNVGTVVAVPRGRDERVRDADPSHYVGVATGPGRAGVRIEKSTNGRDADEAPGPDVPVGEPVVWEYVVTNTGNLPLGDIVVEDNPQGRVECPRSALDVGDSMTCRLRDTAEPGPYRNIGIVVAVPRGRSERVSDEDPSHYVGVAEEPGRASVRIEKSTNERDADEAPGPEIPVGEPVVWEYVISNTGDLTLGDIVVEDNPQGRVDCPHTELDPGDTMTCRIRGTAEPGPYRNVGIVVAVPRGRHDRVSDEDPSHYVGVTPGGSGVPR